MVKIRDDLTIDQLRSVMEGLLTENPAHQQLVASVHSILQRPENIFYRDFGQGRAMLVARNNTLLCPRISEQAVWYLGGCRWKRYQSEADAEMDVKNLSRGMSYKWAILNLMFSKMALDGRGRIEEVSASRIGGGKSVIMEPTEDHQALTRTGERLSGLEKTVLRDKVVPVLLGLRQYIFAPDMGTCCAHVDYVAKYAPENVACLSREDSGSGDPSLITARGPTNPCWNPYPFKGGLKT